jgi:hypothetical protein
MGVEVSKEDKIDSIKIITDSNEGIGLLQAITKGKSYSEVSLRACEWLTSIVENNKNILLRKYKLIFFRNMMFLENNVTKKISCLVFINIEDETDIKIYGVKYYMNGTLNFDSYGNDHEMHIYELPKKFNLHYYLDLIKLFNEQYIGKNRECYINMYDKLHAYFEIMNKKKNN